MCADWMDPEELVSPSSDDDWNGAGVAAGVGRWSSGLSSRLLDICLSFR